MSTVNRLLKTLMLALAALVASCGGSSGTPTGTLRVSLTDAPACGYDHVWVTISAVRVHRSGTAGDNDGGWVDLDEIDASSPKLPMRIDLLTLTNGALAALGRATLPVGRYSQLRLVLSPNRPNDPTANAVVLTGSTTEIPLDTPSGTQSGLKLNVGFDVTENQTTDVVLDFDASKSVVSRGGTGAFNLKPVIRAVPITGTGMRVLGYLAAPAGASSRVSLQTNGVSVVSTVADAAGTFALYPVPAGTYDLVIQSPLSPTATITGVSVSDTEETTIGSTNSRIQLPASSNPLTMRIASGSVVTSDKPIYASVAAIQQYSEQPSSQPALPAGPRVVVAECMVDETTGGFALSLPNAAPFLASYKEPLTFTEYTIDAGRYTLAATSGGVTKQTTDRIDVMTRNSLGNVFTFP
jgi:Domain of unknown function (DUF4382)